MSDPVPDTAPSHGAMFWKFAIFEGSVYVIMSMGACFLAASAVWTDESYAKMTTWRWWVLGISIFMAGLNKLQSYMSTTITVLKAKAKVEDDTSFFRKGKESVQGNPPYPKDNP